jgi:hypothetical protein
VVTKLLFVTGATNAGKSTFLAKMASARRDAVGLVEVGKALRKKYGDAYFQGQAAPKHTAAEAWQLMVEGIDFLRATGRQVILIDGQPRDIEQADMIYNEYAADPSYDVEVVNLYCPTWVRRLRAERRDGGDAEKLKLSMARMEGDLPRLYEVLSVVMQHGLNVLTFDTSLPSYDLDEIADALLSGI